jgi:tripartite-type tricarboxylate transporter receptor subunit TctC
MRRSLRAARTILALLVAIGLGDALRATAVAASDYPNRPVHIVVPVLAGGPFDTAGRLLADGLSKELGQPVIIDNRPGAGGNIGTEAVVRAAPDGYTLLLGAGSNLAIGPALYTKLPFNASTDLAPIGPFGELPNVLVVSAKSPIKTFAELAEFLRQKGPAASFASGGPGTTSHIHGEILKKQLGLGMVHVPYRGEPPALMDLERGDIQVMFSALSSCWPLIQGGMLRPIAVAAPERIAALPDVPTLKELNVKGLEFGIWYGLLAPKGTPKEIVELLGTHMRKALQDPALRKRFAAIFIDVFTQTPDEFNQFILQEAAKMKPIVEATGISQ